jgi:chromosome segregation ATPase
VEQLQDELSFVEDERAEIAKKLGEKESQLDEVARERAVLTKQMNAATKRINSLEQAKVDLEAQILNLEEEVADLRKVREELVQMKGVREELKQQVKELTGQLDAVETSRKAFESDLAASRDLASGQEEGIKKYRKNLEAAHNRLADLSEQLEEQQLENRNLMETKRGLERVVKTLTAKNEVISADLDATKKALFEIHGAATRTSKRIHSRYYKSDKSKKE